MRKTNVFASVITPAPAAPTATIVDVPDSTTTINATATSSTVPPRPVDDSKKLDLLVDMLKAMEIRVGSVEKALN